MAQHKSALKRIRQTERRNKRNRHLRSTLRSCITNFRSLLTGKETEKAQAAYPLTQKMIDKSVSKGVLKKQTAGRYKSRLSIALKQLVAVRK